MYFLCRHGIRTGRTVWQDFLCKHAEAVSLYADVKVLYVHADKEIKDFQIIKQAHNQ